MKVAIVTFQQSSSYGALFQCLGLVEAVKLLGHEVEVIDYHPHHRKLKTRIPRKIVVSPRAWVDIRYRFLFQSAIKALLPLTSRRYSNFDALSELADKYDVVICGSDQIWNAKHTGGSFDAAYFAAFCGENTTTIAYAASLGTSSIDKAHETRFASLLKHLDFIALREESGAVISQKFTETECSRMPDPTVLYNNFARFASPRQVQEKYVLSFRLEDSPLYTETIAQTVSDSTSNLVHIKDSKNRLAVQAKSVVPSPTEWLSLIKNCEHLVTNSYHGILFAILFNRPFTAVALKEHGGARNERITSVLKTLGLETLFVSNESEIKESISASRKIDWQIVNRELLQEQERGRSFLAGSIDKIL